jgi:hypothetical protein
VYTQLDSVSVIGGLLIAACIDWSTLDYSVKKKKIKTNNINNNNDINDVNEEDDIIESSDDNCDVPYGVDNGIEDIPSTLSDHLLDPRLGSSIGGMNSA